MGGSLGADTGVRLDNEFSKMDLLGTDLLVVPSSSLENLVSVNLRTLLSTSLDILLHPQYPPNPIETPESNNIYVRLKDAGLLTNVWDNDTVMDPCAGSF